MNLDDAVERIETRQDLAEFVLHLSAAAAGPESDLWENVTLTGFLESLSAWITDTDSYRRSRGLPVPEQATWRSVGEMLVAATAYE